MTTQESPILWKEYLEDDLWCVAIWRQQTNKWAPILTSGVDIHWTLNASHDTSLN